MRGGTQDSQVPGVIACTGAAIADLFSRPVIRVRCFWKGFSEVMISGKSKFGPSVLGVHLSMTAPCGKYTNPSLGLGAAAVLASAVAAGIMASSSGRPTLTPKPRRTLRRLRNFLVMNMIAPYGEPATGVAV